MKTGRIEVHAHLLPGVDDGCQSVEDSMDCARSLVELGYTHCFCTPHIWRTLPHNHVREIERRVATLQAALDQRQIPLRLLPGGEINLRPDIHSTAPEEVVSYGLAGRHVLVDLWADALPPHFEQAVRWLQSLGLSVILAHPERMRAVQADPGLANRFAELGVLLQGNFQCFSDAPELPTRRVAERFLREGRYFMLGSDLHGRETLPPRLAGMQRAREMVDDRTFDRLTIEHPARLLPGAGPRGHSG